GIPPTFIDSNEGNIEAAREAGLTAHAGNIHSEDFLSSIDFSDIGKALALTANDEINAFAQHEMSKFVGRANVYALPQRRPEAPASIDRHPDAAFGNDMTFNRLEGFFYSGAVVRSLTVTEQTSWEELREKEQLKAIPLFQARTDGTLQVHTEQSPIETLRKGTNLIFLSLDAANPRKGD
ncbi:MAG: NAD-binding protein, partial [Verrucomicrobiota bacterium]